MATAVDFNAELQTLTVNQLNTVAQQLKINLTSATKRSKTKLISAILAFSVPGGETRLLDELDSMPRKAGRKRKRNEFLHTFAVKIDTERSAKRNRTEAVEALVNGQFLTCADGSTLKSCTKQYLEATSNKQLASGICMVCARRLPLSDLTDTDAKTLKNGKRLIPRPEDCHPAQFVIDGMLFHKNGMVGSKGRICVDCSSDLANNTTPRYSLANSLWIGDIPTVLSILTLPERILIARYFPAAYVVKLFPKDKRGGFNPAALNNGLRGNVSTYALNSQDLAQYIQSRQLPHPPQILASTIAITFVNPRGVPEKTLPQMFSVSRTRLLDAIHWLHGVNPIYEDITINDDALRSLPENGVPDELYAITRTSDDVDALRKEHESYVPTDYESDQPLNLPHAGLIPIDNDDGSAHDNSSGQSNGCVLPVQSHGVVNVSGSDVTDSQLMANALSNLARSPESAKVQRGSMFVNEYPRLNHETGKRWTGGADSPNHLLGAFPVLFPYGRGGFETDRPVDLTYQRHAQWALQYEDRRFRKDHQFMFQVFGVIVKRQIASSTVLQIGQTSFQRHAEAIRKLTPSDLIQASIEENLKRKFSNPTVQMLRNHLSAVRSKVIGTDENRRGIRSQIWGTCTMYGPPSIWLTINPSDIHDPIAQVLTGERIDLDNFCADAGPDVSQRAENIAGDPYAAAEFFHHTVRVTLSQLLGIDALKRNGATPIKRTTGLLGRIQAYIGTVEAQGRGTLHLHILLWLEGAPTSEKMAAGLADARFRDKIRAFINQNCHAHLPGMNADAIEKLPSRGSATYSRPVDPDHPNFLAKVEELYILLVRTLQLHSCKSKACIRFKRGEAKCKRGSPFQLSGEAWVSIEGTCGPQRNHPYLVTWHPVLLWLLRCNHNIELLLNSGETRKIAWYLTLYATKKQEASSNVSALLAKTTAYHIKDERSRGELDSQNKRLIQRCANALNRDHEFSAPEVVSYVMGWGDRYISHHFVKIYWSNIVRKLKEHYGRFDEETDEAAQGHTRTLQISHGRVTARDQSEDYVHRHPNLEAMSLLRFFLDTYETSDANGDAPGYPYISGHKPGKHRRLRREGHETLPDFVGQWLPRRPKEGSTDYYHASMLSLLRPWRGIEDIKMEDQTFADAFKEFIESSSESTLDIIDNINFYYESADAAHAASGDEGGGGGPVVPDEDEMAWETVGPAVEQERAITEEDIEHIRQNAENMRDRHYGEDAMNAAQGAGIFPENAPSSSWLPIAPRSSDLLPTQLDVWEAYIQRATAEPDNGTETATTSTHDRDDETMDVPWQTEQRVAQEPAVSAEEAVAEPPAADLSIADLNTEQRRAFKIVQTHSDQLQKGSKPKQLLMLVNGSGGTGKTRLIDAISDLFKQQGLEGQLARTATAGVPAARIGGTTIHWWAGLNGLSDVSANPSKRIADRRKRTIGRTKYLIIDEYSMMTKRFLAQLSEVCCDTMCKMGTCNKEPFGGINVILFGDLHQFPPVGASHSALYSKKNPRKKDASGREIFERFETCIILEKQMRVHDDEWNGMLNRLRTGDCTGDDVDMVRSLVLDDEDPSNNPDFTKEPWKNVILITPRHSVRRRWNHAALRRHSAETGHCIYVSPAVDRVSSEKRPLNNWERGQVASLSTRATNRIEEETEICVGMRAMLQVNVATELDISNGTRGTITKIILDEREGETTAEGGVVRLKYPPACVIFKPEFRRGVHIPGLEENELPIFPTETKFQIARRGGGSMTITRLQLAITPAYAFTDYKSQGQTIEYVLVDLKQPKLRALNAFNAYVALSRSRGRDTIRLLRNFDTDLLTTHPSEDLVEEDKRLIDLREKTKGMYN